MIQLVGDYLTKIHSLSEDVVKLYYNQVFHTMYKHMVLYVFTHTPTYVLIHVYYTDDMYMICS